MADEALTVEIAVARTRELFSEDGDYSYITEDLIAADAKMSSDGLPDEKLNLRTLYGHRPTFGYLTMNGVRYSGYWKTHGGNWTLEGACGTGKRLFTRPEQWRQSSHGQCPNGAFRVGWSQ